MLYAFHRFEQARCRLRNLYHTASHHLPVLHLLGDELLKDPLLLRL